MENGKTLRLLIADDHNIVREGLRMILEREKDIEVVAEADNGVDALHLALKLRPDLMLVDVTMPGMSGIETAQRVLEEIPGMSILVLSMCEEKQLVIEALSAGAKGYLLKDCAATDLVVAIRNVAAGGVYLSQKVAGLIVKEYIQRPIVSEGASVAPGLSPREREVLQLIADGKNTKEIAFGLNVSVKTVETYRQNVMKKLDLHSVAELVKYAIREGIVSVDD
jgi:DNA-binding NarL/FixJ family response regulator